MVIIEETLYTRRPTYLAVHHYVFKGKIPLILRRGRHMAYHIYMFLQKKIPFCKNPLIGISNLSSYPDLQNRLNFNPFLRKRVINYAPNSEAEVILHWTIIMNHKTFFETFSLREIRPNIKASSDVDKEGRRKISLFCSAILDSLSILCIVKSTSPYDAPMSGRNVLCVKNCLWCCMLVVVTLFENFAFLFLGLFLHVGPYRFFSGSGLKQNKKNNLSR